MKAMKNIIAFLLFASVLSTVGCKSQTESTMKSVKERIEWSRTWIPDTDNNDLPRILLIGDSHVERYYPLVQKKLEGVAYCGKLTTSKSLGDPVLLDEVKLIMKQYEFAVISFNNGLHGKGYSEAQYGNDIPLVFDLFKKYSHAKIIWVNTTPVRKRENLSEFDDFTARVKERNTLVREYLKSFGIPIVDLYSLGAQHVEYYTGDGVHFNAEGVEAEAGKVAAKIKELL